MESGIEIESRRLKRFVVNVKVYDQKSGERLGYTANMHTEGMMLNSFEKIELNRDFKIKLEFMTLDDDVIEIYLTASSLWCEPATNPDFFNCGFCFIDLSMEQVEQIRKLIHLLEVKT